ncbi:MAG: L,D-transpeptidase [Ktedonobacterales bacterium]
MIGIPSAMLAPISSQEQQVAAVNVQSSVEQRQIVDDYATLYSQVLALEQSSTQTLHDQTAGDIQLLMQALSASRSQGFSDINIYQARLDSALSAFALARTTAEYAQVDASVVQQLTALRSLWPTWQKLQTFRMLLRTFALAGIPATAGEQQYQQDRAAVDSALSPAGYTRLSQLIDSQTQQVTTDQLATLADNTTTLLPRLQAGITLLRQNGDPADAAMLQQAQTRAMRLLATIRLPGAATAVTAMSAGLIQQIEAMSLPLQRAQARSDLRAYTQLLAQAQQHTLLDPFTGRRYPAAYEYADKSIGLGLMQQKVATAKRAQDYQKADDDVLTLTANLHALVSNLHDPTPHDKPHKTDLDLLTRYDLLQGKVVVVSLTEQTARFYDHGKLVYWSYVTTGRIELPSPPGVHFAMTKNAPVLFTSPEPRSSPLWFAPTPVTYAIAYATGGDFLHDAWWRNQFGPGTQLPHYDPAAFNGGSHGCINFPKQQMQWVYNWMQVGTPVLVY